MLDEFAKPMTNPKQEHLRQVVLAARDKAREYLTEAGFVLAPDTPDNIARIICDSMECEFDGESFKFVADGKDFADHLNRAIVKLTPREFPIMLGVFRFDPLLVDRADTLTGEEALPKAGLVLEAQSDDYRIRVKSYCGDSRLLLIYRGDDLTMQIGSVELASAMQRLNVTISPPNRTAIFNFSLRTRN